MGVHPLIRYLMRILLISILLALAVCLYAQDTVYVDQLATGTNDGSSWQNAFFSLQNALIDTSKKTILIAGGIYYPSSTNNRKEAFDISHLNEICGGFGKVGTIYLHDPNKFVTIFSGDIGKIGDSTDNSHHIFYCKRAHGEVLIQSITIKESNALDAGFPGNRGGGIYCDNASASTDIRFKIANCSFELNRAFFGGAVYFNRSNPTKAILSDFKSCTFVNNYAHYGGGAIYFPNVGASKLDTVFLTECRFYANKSAGTGGCISIEEIMGTFYFQGCNFEHNFSQSDGASIFLLLLENTYGQVVVDNVRFIANSSNNSNFALVHRNNAGNRDTIMIKVQNTQFEQNRSRGGDGGAFYSTSNGYTKVDIAHCNFDKNFSQNNGGAVFIDNRYYFDLTIESCIFSKNRTAGGGWGGLYYQSSMSHKDTVDKSNLLIGNTVFANNQDAIGIGSGVNGTIKAKIINSTFFSNGMYPIAKTYDKTSNYLTKYTTIELQNCILWENAPIELLLYNGDYKKYSINDYYLKNCVVALPGLKYNNYDADRGGNIFLKYPLFKDTLSNDFSLLPCSPLINKGDRKYVDSLGITTDLVGNPRIFQDSVDIGAYESQVQCTVNNMEITSTNTINLLPNLVQKGTTVQLGVPDSQWNKLWQVEVFDISGQLCLSQSISGDQSFVAPQNAGFYVVQLREGSRLLGVGKLVVVE